MKLIISGRVQNVGFRHFVKKHAQERDIKGYVKNKEDGTIEIIGEGEEKNINEFIEKCEQGPLRSQVDSVDRDEEEAKKEYAEFRIKK